MHIINCIGYSIRRRVNGSDHTERNSHGKSDHSAEESLLEPHLWVEPFSLFGYPSTAIRRT